MISPGAALVRAARAVLSPRNELLTPYVARRDPPGQFGGGAVADQAGQLNSTASNGTLFSIINTLSTDVAAVDWHMHRTIRQREGAMCPDCDMPGVTMVPKHPALQVLNHPNDYFTRYELFESVQQHIDLVGEGWMTVAYAMGRPVELWPVRPDRMAPVRDPDNYLVGYVYRAPDGQLVPLGKEEVLFIRVPNPIDPYRGMGAVQSLINQLWGARYAAEWNRRFFENSALPDGIIEIPNHLSDPEFEEFQDRFMETHKGVSNAHTVGMLEHGAKWIDLKYTQRDMEFVELRKVTREEIREAFGVHGHVLGMSESVNRANAEAADTAHARRKVVPRLDRWNGKLNAAFLPMFGDAMATGYELCYENPVPDDREGDNAERTSKAGVFVSLIGARTTPEYAAMVAGLPPPEMMPDPEPASMPGAGPAAGGEPDQSDAEESPRTTGPEGDGQGGTTGSGQQDGGGDGAAMDARRTWAPVKLSARALPGMLNAIHDRLSVTGPTEREEVGHGR